MANFPVFGMKPNPYTGLSTKEEVDKQTREELIARWDAVAKMPSVAHGTLGYLWGRITLGIPDAVIARIGQNKAFNDLEEKATGMGYKVTRARDDAWVLTNEAGRRSVVNPIKITDGWYAKDLAELNARMSGYDVEPEDKLAYNLGKMFGSIKTIAGGTKGVGKLAVRPSIARIGQAGLTGALYGTVQEIQERIKGEPFDFKNVWETGGWFALFGIAEVGLSGIKNAYKMQKFFQTKEGQLLLTKLSKGEIKTLVEAGRETAKLAQYNEAAAQKVRMKIYGSQGVKPVEGMDLSPTELDRILARPVMSKDSILKVYGKRLNKIWEKLDGVKAQESAAAKAGESMTRNMLAAPSKAVRMKGAGEKAPTVEQEALTAEAAAEGEIKQQIDEAFIKGDYETIEELAKNLPENSQARDDAFSLAFHMRDNAGKLEEKFLTLEEKAKLALELQDMANKFLAAKSVPAQQPATGKPYTAKLYRGTSTEGPLDEGVYGKATYYTPDKTVAEHYKRGKGEILEQEVSLENPFVGTEADFAKLQPTPEERRQYESQGLSQKEYNDIAAQKITDELKSRGHDGFVLVDEEGNVLEVGTYLAPQPATSIEPSNPYLTMPIEDVRNLAAYGVQGAKDFLAEIEPEKIIPAASSQKKAILAGAMKYGISGDSLSRMMLYITGQSNVDSMTKDEAADMITAFNNYAELDPDATDAVVSSEEYLIDDNLSTDELAKIRREAGDTETYNRVINYSNMLGGAPKNPNVPDLEGRKKLWASELREDARIQRRFRRKLGKLEPYGAEASTINPYQSIGYALDRAEKLTGIPLRRMWQDMVADVSEWTNWGEDIVWTGITDAKAHRWGKVTNRKSNLLIGAWLDAADNEAIADAPEDIADYKADLWNQMDEKTQALALEAEKILQGPSAMAVRWMEYEKWSYAARLAKEKLNAITAKGEEPTKNQIKALHDMVKAQQPINAPAEALKEGEIAKELGQFHDWLEAQTWGTRKNYFMHEADIDTFLDSLEGASVPQELFQMKAETGTLPLKPPSESFPRKGKSKAIKTGNVMLAILRHMNRLTASASTYQARANFWNAFKKSNPSKEDIGNMRDAMDALIGIYHKTPRYIKSARRLDRWMWRAILVGNPRGSIWFAWRQALQNLAFAPSQVSMTELVKAMKDLPHFDAVARWAENTENVPEAFDAFYKKHTAEGRSVYRHMVMKSEELSGLEMTSKAATVFDMLGFMPSVTDSANRWGIWPLLYRMAERNLGAFREGRINGKKLLTRLKIHTLTGGQSKEMQRLLDDGDYAKFMERYAEYKTENIHFRYNPQLRGIYEMGSTGRVLLGLIVFPRGVLNIALKNAVEPMLHGSPKKFFGGLNVLIKLLVGTTFADELSKRITGRSAYDIVKIMFGYGPLSVGASKIREIWEETSSIVEQSDGKDTRDTINKLLQVSANNLEIFIPLCDVMIDAYKVKNDIKYAHLYTIARAEAMSELARLGTPFKYANRSTADKLRLMIFGTETSDDKSEAAELQEALSHRNRRKIFK